MRGCHFALRASGSPAPGAPARAVSPPEAIAWRLQREIVLLLAWGPAILLQLAHPLVARGVADHSAFLTERWGRVRRFNRTVDAMLRLCFGTEPEARAAVARINAIHDRVHGRLGEAAGIFPAGTPYSAHDPALLAWVHATLLVMNLRVYELYVGDLSPEEEDRYCAEASAIESPLGIPVGSLPRTTRALGDYMDATLRSGAIAVTETARTLARAVVYPPGTRVAGPAALLTRLPTLGLLPVTVREAYGFPWRSRDEALFRCSAGVIRRLLRVAPPVIRHWPAARRASRSASDRPEEVAS